MPTTPLDYTASTCNRCAHVANATTAPCPVCKSTSGQTLITQAPSFGITA
jgi:hypothetical protein